MRSKARLLILLSPLFLTGMRDPFSVPEERCAAGAAQPVAVSGDSQRQQGYRSYAGRAEALVPGKNAGAVTDRLAGERDR